MKEPLALFITDTHLSENSLEVNFSVYQQAVAKCQELGIGQIFHGGDIFTSRKGQPEIVLNAFHSILEMLEANKINMFAIAGNHDKTDYTSSSSYLEAFTHHASFKLFAPYGAMMHDDRIIFHFLPYYDEDLIYADYIDQIECPADKVNILITHVGIEGVLNNHQIAGKFEKVTPALFQKFDLVLIGHYHNRIVLDKGRIIYTGSTHQATFGEDEEKGFVIIYDDGTISFDKFVTPIYRTIDITGDQIDKKLIKMAKQNAENNDRIRLRISGDYEEAKQSMVADLQELGVKVEKIKDEYVAGDIMQRESVQASSTDVIDSYHEWAIQREAQGDVDLDIAYGAKLLEQAL